MTATSDAYEEFVQQVMAALTGAQVHHKKPYVGRISHREIVVDVSFETSVAGARLLCLVECKCYAHAVSVDEVEEFHSKLDDIGAHKGIMVTTIGYQEGAVKVAEGRGIALAVLTENHTPGELVYRTLAAAPRDQPLPTQKAFWQGNLRGPLGDYGRVFRFENTSQFFWSLFLDEREAERLRVVARWNAEHGTGKQQ